MKRNKADCLLKLSAAVIFLLTTALMLTSGGCDKGHGKTTEKKIIILGFDGMDPDILEPLIKAGKMPNFKKFMKTGDYRKLATSIPPQSPVAWSNFITGMNPGGHGIFDFIHRDPQTMIPYLSTSEIKPAGKKISLGKWVIPLSKDRVVLLRAGTSFWETLEEHGIPATVIRVPANFPPVKSGARSLSGMGTPDIQGTYGMFSFYTGTPTEDEDITGGRVFKVNAVNNKIDASLFGPKNTFKKGAPRSKADFSVYIDPEHPVAKIQIQENRIILNQGEWSPWVRIKFEIIPFIKNVSGICRFYLKEVRPNFKLYVTPVNIDPSDPAMPVSTPEDLVKELYEEVGPFYTQGMPEDTKALSGGILDDDEFLKQAHIVFDEYSKMFDYELNNFSSGLLFFYFGSTDQISHMFWRTMDPEHPLYDPGSKNKKAIEKTYIEMDAVLGKTMKKIDSKTTLIILSDHGFAPYYRSFNLNTWLKNKGYITLKDTSIKGEFFQNVDWGNTRAYGLGFNGLYLNLIGREMAGIVETGMERESLMNEISEKLLALRDPKTGKQVISRVYRAEEIYTGPHVKDAPDLVIGYNRGYRSSWETVLGEFPEGLFKDNREKWSGSHLMAAELVPGILLTNKKIKSENPALYDIAPTILQEFGIEKNMEMKGNTIF